MSAIVPPSRSAGHHCFHVRRCRGRPGGGQEHRRGDELPHRDHPRRSKRWKSVGSDTGADLIADAAARHGQQAAENSGLGVS
ncbi:hypothetical protein [Arthrobacter sp. Soil736]|uniref:hypothetical protein n=1 Tax=Arthrobacter sp. Soil736 TaxID=1736395 RepID=UPI001F11D5C7|nr:hypothetical protein [Arthrobacter sp. Soil736]